PADSRAVRRKAAPSREAPGVGAGPCGPHVPVHLPQRVRPTTAGDKPPRYTVWDAVAAWTRAGYVARALTARNVPMHLPPGVRLTTAGDKPPRYTVWDAVAAWTSAGYVARALAAHACLFIPARRPADHGGGQAPALHRFGMLSLLGHVLAM